MLPLCVMSLNTLILEPNSNSQVRQEEVLVTGQPTTVILNEAIPRGANRLILSTEGEIVVQLPDGTEFAGEIILETIPEQISLLARTYSVNLGDRLVTLEFGTENRAVRYTLELTAVRICLDVDANRDGLVDDDNPRKKDWQWGSEGQGAIFMVNSDQDIDYSDGETNLQNRQIDGLLDLKDLALLIVRKTGFGDWPRGYELRLVVSESGRGRVRIFENLDTYSGRELIGPGHNEARIRIWDTRQDLVLALEGLHYRDRDFDGLVDISLIVERDGEPYHLDWVRLRVAPWIMTPNTLLPRVVYMAQTENNQTTIEAVRQVVGRSGTQLEEVSPELNLGDRWLQDELEIGYTQMPAHLQYVALESPRYRGLEDFPESLLGADFGYVTRGSIDARTRLDSFGNLEVSPPVTVNGRNYHLGRILYGDTDEVIPPAARRRFQPALRDFLRAQQVQAPVQLFSDWLNVGHIDEFLTFVPAPTPKAGLFHSEENKRKAKLMNIKYKS